MNKNYDAGDIIFAIVIAIVCIAVISGSYQIGKLQRAYEIGKECQMLSGFAVDDDVYKCVKRMSNMK